MATRFRNITGPGIRKARERAGFTQDQLAAKLQLAGLVNFDRVTVAKVEGQIRSVYDYELVVVARVLKCEVIDLMPGRRAVDDALGDLVGG